MFLHAGNNFNIREKDIIGIFDMDNATVSSITRKFLVNYEKQDIIYSVVEELPKSFILYKKNGKNMIVFSPLAVSSLMGRIKEKNVPKKAKKR